MKNTLKWIASVFTAIVAMTIIVGLIMLIESLFTNFPEVMTMIVIYFIVVLLITAISYVIKKELFD